MTILNLSSRLTISLTTLFRTNTHHVKQRNFSYVIKKIYQNEWLKITVWCLLSVSCLMTKKLVIFANLLFFFLLFTVCTFQQEWKQPNESSCALGVRFKTDACGVISYSLSKHAQKMLFWSSMNNLLENSDLNVSFVLGWDENKFCLLPFHVQSKYGRMFIHNAVCRCLLGATCNCHAAE